MARLRRLLPLLLALALGCARVPPPPPPAPAPAADPTPTLPDRLAPIRADLAELLAEQAEMLWRAWTSGAAADPRQALAKRERLLDPGTLALVRQAGAGAAGEERRRLQLLEAFLVGERLARDTARSADRLATARAQAVATWEGREIPVRRLTALLSGEADAGRRAAIEKAQAQAEQRWAPAAEEHRRELLEAARALGQPDLLALAPLLRGASAEALSARAEAVLAATRPAYLALLELLARRELGVPFERLRGRDLPRLLALAQDGRAFPAGKALEAGLSTLRALGTDLRATPGVTLDAGARGGKDPRALLLPVSVPGDVRLSLVPAAGVSEARAELRVLGGAAFLAGVRAPEPEVRLLAGVAQEAFGGLFEELAGDPTWLLEHTGLSEHNLEPLVRAGAARRLHLVREQAARLLLEVGRQREPARAAELARDACERFLARPPTAEEVALFAADPDPLLRSADLLVGQLLAAQAEAWLVAAGGPAWWRSPAAAERLRGAFAAGARPDAAELAAAFGQAHLDAAALLQRTAARAERAGLRLPP